MSDASDAAAMYANECRKLRAELAAANELADKLLRENELLWAYNNDAAAVSAPTLARCNAHIGDEKSPLERLRFFLSLALKRQDWIDVEPFLDALAAQAQPAAMCGCGDTFGDGSVCANCLAGIDCKPVPDDEPAAVPDGFVLVRDVGTHGGGSSEADVAYTEGWNDCRIAMLATNQQDNNA